MQPCDQIAFQIQPDHIPKATSVLLLCRDPLANSFVAPLTADMADDVRLSVEDYARSPSDDEEYGIDHLKQHENADEQVPILILDYYLF
jgi:hypothetical protein